MCVPIGQGIPEKSPEYGKRQDGTEKGSGYFGEMKRPDGKISTEISVGVDFGRGQMEIPTLVPSLSKDEVDHLLSGKSPTRAIMDKAVDHAVKRLDSGKPVFAGPGEAIRAPSK